LVFIKRTSYPGVHSAQISFPGGKAEKHDADILQTALRETEEEIGVAATDIEILGNLSRVYIPPSNFMVQPVVGAIPYKPTFTPHSKEVDVLLPMPFEAFLTANTMQNTRVETRGLVMHVPAFNVQNEIIWGATAMMVAELRALFIK
jgi:8-oxo-dGTP pyrophosphatase MutT (NUDIX family)